MITNEHRCRLYARFRGSVYYLEVGNSTSRTRRSIGSCFHLGEGIFITARHVVEEEQQPDQKREHRRRVSRLSGAVAVASGSQAGIE
jgi:hypothetical protein